MQAFGGSEVARRRGFGSGPFLRYIGQAALAADRRSSNDPSTSDFYVADDAVTIIWKPVIEFRVDDLVRSRIPTILQNEAANLV